MLLDDWVKDKIMSVIIDLNTKETMTILQTNIFS